jgi:hypothetical protein
MGVGHARISVGCKLLPRIGPLLPMLTPSSGACHMVGFQPRAGISSSHMQSLSPTLVQGASALGCEVLPNGQFLIHGRVQNPKPCENTDASSPLGKNRRDTCAVDTQSSQLGSNASLGGEKALKHFVVATRQTVSFQGTSII